MPGLKDPQEREIVRGLESPPLYSVDCIRLQLFTSEVFLALERDLFRNSFVPKPVTDPVCITGPDQHRDSTLNDAGKLREECPRI